MDKFYHVTHFPLQKLSQLFKKFFLQIELVSLRHRASPSNQRTSVFHITVGVQQFVAPF